MSERLAEGAPLQQETRALAMRCKKRAYELRIEAERLIQTAMSMKDTADAWDAEADAQAARAARLAVEARDV